MTHHPDHRHRRAGHQRPGTRRAGRPARAWLADAAVVVEGSRIAWVGPAAEAPAADVRVDAGGRAVIPGFVDSHSHLVFAGDRAAEFAARMTGEPYSAGGIRTTVAPTRAATDEQLTSHVARLVAEMRAQGTTIAGDQERLRAVGPRRGAQPRGGPPVHRRDHLPRRPRRPGRHHPRGLRRPRHRPDARGGGTARPVDRRVLRGRRLRRRPGTHHPGSGHRQRPARTAPRQPADVRRRASSSPASSAWSRSTTAPTSPTLDVESLSDSGTIATLLPGVEFSTRQPYPDARGLLDAGVRVALASDCNPGSCFTSSMALCIALAVREMRMSPAEALHAATAMGAAALDRDDVGVLAPGKAADLVLLDAPSYVHLAYRPGVPLVAGVWQARPPASSAEVARQLPQTRVVRRSAARSEVAGDAEIGHLPDVRAYLSDGISSHGPPRDRPRRGEAHVHHRQLPERRDHYRQDKVRQDYRRPPLGPPRRADDTAEVTRGAIGADGVGAARHNVVRAGAEDHRSHRTRCRAGAAELPARHSCVRGRRPREQPSARCSSPATRASARPAC